MKFNYVKGMSPTPSELKIHEIAFNMVDRTMFIKDQFDKVLDIIPKDSGTVPSGGGDMLKSVYDTNNDGIVDNAKLANGFIVLTSVPAGAVFTDTTYLAGTGLLLTSTTFSLDFSQLVDKTTDITATTEFILQDGTTESRKAASEIKLGLMNNNLGWTSNTGTVSSLADLGITATAGELNYTTNVTSDIQAQLNGKVDDSQVLTNVPAGAVFTDTLTDLSMTVGASSIAVNSSSGTDITLPLATNTLSGLLSPSAVIKLSSIDTNRYTVNVSEFGAVGNGTTDDTTAIQNALNTGKHIIGDSNKKYRITTALTISVSGTTFELNGELYLDSATASMSAIIVGNQAARTLNVIVRNMTITRNQAGSSSTAINCKYVGITNIHNVRIWANSKYAYGIYLYKAMITNVYNNYIQDCTLYGIYLEGTDDTDNRTVDTVMRNNRLEGGKSGVSCYDFTEGVFLRENIFYNLTIPAFAASASVEANALYSFKLQHNDFDSATIGVYLKYVKNITINDNWFSNNTQENIILDTNTRDITIDGNQIYGITTHNSLNVHGSSIVISNNIISEGLNCILLQSTAADVVISGNVLKESQNYGVNINASSSKVIVSSNTFALNTAGNIYGANLTTIIGLNSPDDTSIVGTAGNYAIANANGELTCVIVGVSMSYVSGFDMDAGLTFAKSFKDTNYTVSFTYNNIPQPAGLATNSDKVVSRTKLKTTSGVTVSAWANNLWVSGNTVMGVDIIITGRWK